MKPVTALSRSRTPAAVLRRLDIDPAEVALVPTEPAEILTRCLGQNLTHGFPRQRVFAYASASPSPVCRQFMAAMQVLKKADVALLSFEAMCVRARVSPVEMLGAVLMAAKSLKDVEGALKGIMAHPDVVESTISNAIQGPPLMVNGKPIMDAKGNLVLLNHGDTTAQRMLLEARGFLPTKTAGGVNINLGFGRPEEDRDEDGDADEAWDSAFPDLGSQVNEWSADKHKLLEGEK